MRRAGSSPPSLRRTTVRAHALHIRELLQRVLKSGQSDSRQTDSPRPAGSGVRVRAQRRAGAQAHRLQARGLVRAGAWARLPRPLRAHSARHGAVWAHGTLSTYSSSRLHAAVKSLPMRIAAVRSWRNIVVFSIIP